MHQEREYFKIACVGEKLVGVFKLFWEKLLIETVGRNTGSKKYKLKEEFDHEMFEMSLSSGSWVC